MATLKDIAKKSDVSVSTVSRVLKNDKNLKIANDTKTKILKIAKELGYTSKSKTTAGSNIAIINWYSHDQEVLNPYYYYIRKAVEQQCEKQNFTYDSYYKGNDFNSVNSYDGIIAIGKFSKKQAKELKLISSKIIFVDYNPDVEQYDSVEVDFDKLMKEVIEYVIDTNANTTIGLMIGMEDINEKDYKDSRIIYFEKYTKAHGMYNAKYYIEGEFTLKSGYEMFEIMYKEKRLPKVLICGNDLIAMGANKAAYKYGLKVGEDIKIIGIDNIPVAKYMVPSLTTVKIHQKEMGKEAVKLLKRRLEEESTIPIKITVPTKLKIRKST